MPARARPKPPRAGLEPPANASGGSTPPEPRRRRGVPLPGPSSCDTERPKGGIWFPQAFFSLTWATSLVENQLDAEIIEHLERIDIIHIELTAYVGNEDLLPRVG